MLNLNIILTDTNFYWYNHTKLLFMLFIEMTEVAQRANSVSWIL